MVSWDSQAVSGSLEVRGHGPRRATVACGCGCRVGQALAAVVVGGEAQGQRERKMSQVRLEKQVAAWGLLNGGGE